MSTRDDLITIAACAIHPHHGSLGEGLLCHVCKRQAAAVIDALSIEQCRYGDGDAARWLGVPVFRIRALESEPEWSMPADNVRIAQETLRALKAGTTVDENGARTA